MEQKTTQQKEQPQHLRESVEQAVAAYFVDLNGHEAKGLYELFLAEFEQPIFKVVLEHTDKNISQAAAILGMTRTTLRKRLKKYDLG